MTNRAYLDRIKKPVTLPDVDEWRYMIAAFINSGVTKLAGMGVVPLEWADIVAFGQATGAVLPGWEMQTLYDMCRAWHHENSAAEDNIGRIAPMEREGG